MANPATFEQQTWARHTRWGLDWQTDPNGTLTVRIDEVIREGAGGGGGDAGSGNGGTARPGGGAAGYWGPGSGARRSRGARDGGGANATAVGERWHAVITPPWGHVPKRCRCGCGGAGGETFVVHHAYRVRVPGAGVVQPIAGAQGVRFSAVAMAPDGTVWAGGDRGATLVQVKSGALAATLVGRLLEDPDGVEDLVVDALGRLHALVYPPTRSGDIVVVVDQGIFCPTVNVFDTAYPFQSPNPETGIPLPSASTRGLAAEEGICGYSAQTAGWHG